MASDEEIKMTSEALPSIDVAVDEPATQTVIANNSGYFMQQDEVEGLKDSTSSDDQAKLKNKIFFCSAEKFRLRIGPNYSSKKLKAASGKALMELVGCE